MMGPAELQEMGSLFLMIQGAVLPAHLDREPIESPFDYRSHPRSDMFRKIKIL